MVNRLVSVDETFTLPPSVKTTDANLPTRLGTTALNATIAERIAADVPSASTTAAGRVELATTAEVKTGTDSARAATPRTIKRTLRVVASPAATLDRQRALGSVPTYTVSAVDAATTISNPTAVPANTVAKIRTSGAPSIGNSGGLYYGYGITASTVDYPATAWECAFYGRYVEVQVQPGRALTLFADGRPLTDNAIFTPTPAGLYRYKVDFGSVGVHHFKMITNSLVKEFVHDSTAGPMWAPKTPLPITEYYMGDSWTQGYGADGSTVTAYSSAGLGVYCSQLLGTTALIGGQSSTGYTVDVSGSGGKTTFPDRVIPSIVPRNPDRVIIVGSVNDAAASAAAMQAAATLTYQRLADNLPDTEVIVFGMQYPTIKIGDATYNALDDAIAAAAAAAPNVRAFVSMRDWAIPSVFMRADNVHLNDAGYKYVGSRMAHEIARVTAL